MRTECGALRKRRTVAFPVRPDHKTIMLSCCAADLDPALRVVVAEEVFEADIPLANVEEGDSGTRPRSVTPGYVVRRHGDMHPIPRQL